MNYQGALPIASEQSVMPGKKRAGKISNPALWRN